MIKAVLIDDQPENRDHLRSQLLAHADRIEIVGEAGSVHAGIALIGYAQPDLLFLDVELSDGTGFDLLDAVPAYTGRVVFVTAFEKYAVRAFRSNAIDYLLKPVGQDDLEQAVARIFVHGFSDEANRQLYRRALQNAAALRESQQPPQQIVISSLQGMEMIDASKITFIEADNTYSNVYLSNGSKITASRPLLEFEEILDDARFFRVHRSYLINVNHLKRFVSRDAYAELVSGQTVPVSRRKSAAFSSFLKGSAC
ncbi:MAG: LytTR family DNA-binding domain-containing protein [Candidatus Cyclonatronum sp.]|uniref:LytR/AlgR family response regulator transcription factor n=1 Tax=Cyclonatronum sp. TaxID=3024185 RepID=UPI0025BEA5D1|nr:LytTR family DNA-binding domain-containing protein [Cyclonatronum sp.]MCH8488169.1 LytTR family DNA-binding domain-containing protein [Cyclonatronum sp.]